MRGNNKFDREGGLECSVSASWSLYHCCWWQYTFVGSSQLSYFGAQKQGLRLTSKDRIYKRSRTFHCNFFYPGYQKQRHIYLSPRLCALAPVILSIFRPGDCVGRPSRAELQILSSDIQTEYSYSFLLVFIQSKAVSLLFAFGALVVLYCSWCTCLAQCNAFGAFDVLPWILCTCCGNPSTVVAVYTQCAVGET